MAPREGRPGDKRSGPCGRTHTPGSPCPGYEYRCERCKETYCPNINEGQYHGPNKCKVKKS